jgi:spermidine/putrescine transport system ATP-binding protein
MRMIAGFESPTSGDIRIKGKSVIGTPPNRRNVKMVFQHLALFPMMNVYENIAYGLRCAGASKDVIRTKVHDVLERIPCRCRQSRNPPAFRRPEAAHRDCPLHGA